MDSGNSGSLQSSSGGDDEYDSRAAVDSVSAFIGSGGSNPAHTTSFFDPLLGYNFQLRSDPNTHIPLRSDPNTHMINRTTVSTFPPHSQPAAPPAAELPQNPAGARNPRKRSRASRRAPTTVLTTDTTNFRAMVQEFTGIPSPPFNNSPYHRRGAFGARSTSFDVSQTPPYLRRPFAQKVHPPPQFLASSSSSSSLFPSAAAAADSTNTNTISSSIPQINPQIPRTQTTNLFNLNPSPIFPSFLQSNPKFGSFGIIPPNDDQIPNLGDGNHHLHGGASLNSLPNLLASDHHNAAADTVTGRFSFRGTEKESNTTSSGLNFHGEKGTENDVVGREGMMESWICSSK